MNNISLGKNCVIVGKFLEDDYDSFDYSFKLSSSYVMTKLE